MSKPNKPTPAELKSKVSETGSKFFLPENMRFSGDRMSNYRVTGPVTFETWAGDTVTCWELERIRPVKHGLDKSAFFEINTFEQRWPKS